MSDVSPTSEVRAADHDAWRRAAAVLLAAVAALVMIYGLLFMFSSRQADAGQGDVAWISSHGEEVQVTEHLVPGKYTVVDFYADWCANCKEVEPYLEALARSRLDIAIRKVNIGNWSTPVVAQYRLSFIPYLQMYGPDGVLIADGADSVLTELGRRF